MIYHSEVLLSVPDPAREASKYNFQNTAFQLWSWLCWIKDCSYRGDLAHLTLHRKWGIPWRISSVNVTKSAGNCRLVTFTKEFLNRRLHFFVVLLVWPALSRSHCMKFSWYWNVCIWWTSQPLYPESYLKETISRLGRIKQYHVNGPSRLTGIKFRTNACISN